VAGIEVFSVDPEVVERGKRAHVVTQKKIEQHLRSKGITPLSPAPGEPDFDIAWRDNSTIFVAEIKSVTAKNEEMQLRLGLGQVLRYANQLRCKHDNVVPILVAEQAPTDHAWVSVCNEVGAALFSPDDFSISALWHLAVTLKVSRRSGPATLIPSGPPMDVHGRQNRAHELRRNSEVLNLQASSGDGSLLKAR
jgi:hypothetical protein